MSVPAITAAGFTGSARGGFALQQIKDNRTSNFHKVILHLEPTLWTLAQRVNGDPHQLPYRHAQPSRQALQRLQTHVGIAALDRAHVLTDDEHRMRPGHRECPPQRPARDVNRN